MTQKIQVIKTDGSVLLFDLICVNLRNLRTKKALKSFYPQMAADDAENSSNLKLTESILLLTYLR
jgi:hypothetical protein